MDTYLSFNYIKKQNIFQKEFQHFKNNGDNIIEFKCMQHANGGIAVVYAPNGTGKSSFANVLGNDKIEEETSFEAIEDGNRIILPSSKEFHVVGDQISRHVIEGNESDYFIGSNIRREYELKEKVENGFDFAFDKLNKDYKEKYKVSKVSDFLILAVKDIDTVASEFIKAIVNSKSKGRKINKSEFLTYIRNNQHFSNLNDVDEKKKNFVINN